MSQLSAIKSSAKLVSALTMILSLAGGMSQVAHADDESKPAKAAAADENVDDLITNNNLRALSGSKSKWSIASSFTYDGGTIAAPFAEGRPNIAGASAVSTDTDINGQLNIKYNMNAINALLLGFGIRKMAPFTSTGPTAQFYNKGGKDMDAFDPSLIYQRIYKVGVIQSVLQIGYTQYTRQDFISTSGYNLDKGFSLDQENIIEIGSTGLSVGASIGVSGNLPTDYSQDYSRYQYWLDPYVEYQVTEKINLRTVLNLWSYEIYPVENLVQDYVTESVGVGFSVTRDVFVYPNIQFLPDHMTAGLTNVGVTATINLF